ncbi:hypothetical protein BZG01_03270 [Labilibaculum manganireducens]|uniref:NAD-dependent epimerase/dehydratase domain-containing protein n=1 Tax=Labilibaculum manganireducens TaxID=1940525 RepID=A0A2N3IEM3_9BACT|nr:NAD-dependent epimerase/dehydratase family protein [Labilibaculum manganireducens]PKQ68751.1 hypothetical protein BZG01_03270 [Labilibaculum manganireducens]
MTRRKYIVTGACGYIGKKVVEKLISKGEKVIAVDVKKDDFKCEFYQKDLNRIGALDYLIDENSIVIHLAAHANVGESLIDPLNDFNANVVSTINVLESLRKKNGSMVFASTSSVFDLSNKAPLTEKSYKKPTSPYGASKLACEAYCMAYARSYNLDIKIARIFSIYGDDLNRFVIYDLIQKIKANPKVIELFGDGKQIRDFTYIQDIVNGLIFIADKGIIGEDYNLANGRPIKIIELAQLLTELLNKNEIIISPNNIANAGEVTSMYADTSKLKELGFLPRFSLEKGLEKIINGL